MKRLLFYLRAYPWSWRLDLICLMITEVVTIPKRLIRTWFRPTLVESRSILGHIYDVKGTARPMPRGMLVSYNINGRTLRLMLRWNSSDFLVFNQVFIFEEYKKITGLKIDRPVIVDAGANIGCTTLYLASFYPGARFLAIEPDADNFALMCENLKLNGIQNALAEPTALWYCETKVSLSVQHRDNRDWSRRVVQVDGVSQVPANSLNAILRDTGLDAIDILKMDIEGAEDDVFLHDLNLNAVLERIKAIAIEVHSSDNQIARSLTANGFVVERFRETLFGIKKNTYAG